MTNNGRDIASSLSYEERTMCEEGERDLGGRTDYRLDGSNGSVKTRFCVSYQLSSQSFLISRQADGPVARAAAGHARALLSFSPLPSMIRKCYLAS